MHKYNSWGECVHLLHQLKKVEEELKLVGLPNEEQFDAITAKLQEVYDEQSAEACGQRTVREKIVFDFQEFVQQTKGCEGVLYIGLHVLVLVLYYFIRCCSGTVWVNIHWVCTQE